jgi:hypothetical protein
LFYIGIKILWRPSAGSFLSENLDTYISSHVLLSDMKKKSTTNFIKLFAEISIESLKKLASEGRDLSSEALIEMIQSKKYYSHSDTFDNYGGKKCRERRNQPILKS